MTDPMLPLPGLSPVSGKTVVAKFDGGLLSPDGRVLALCEVEQRLRVSDRLSAGAETSVMAACDGAKRKSLALQHNVRCPGVSSRHKTGARRPGLTQLGPNSPSQSSAWTMACCAPYLYRPEANQSPMRHEKLWKVTRTPQTWASNGGETAIEKRNKLSCGAAFVASVA